METNTVFDGIFKGNTNFVNIFHPHLWIELSNHLDSDSYSCLYFSNKMIQKELEKLLPEKIKTFDLLRIIKYRPCHFYQWLVARNYVVLHNYDEKLCFSLFKTLIPIDMYICELRYQKWEKIKDDEFKNGLKYLWFWYNYDTKRLETFCKEFKRRYYVYFVRTSLLEIVEAIGNFIKTQS